MNRNNVALIVGSVFGAVLTLVVLQALHASASADGNPATDKLTRVIPYTGRLERDGVAVNGTAEMRFRLYNRGAAAASYVWTGSYTGTSAVSVVNGRFQVLLGDNSPLTTAVNDAEELYLGIEVMRNGAWESLGKQQVAATTYALWTPQSTNLRVGGTLTVGGAATFSGGLALTGTATLTNAKSTVLLGGSSTAATRTGTHSVVVPGTAANNGVALQYDTASNQLAVKRRTDGVALFTADADNGNVDIAGAATFGASSSANGDVTLREGHDVTIPGASRVTLSRKSTTRSGVTLGSNTNGEGFELLYSPLYQITYIRTGTNENSGTGVMTMADLSGSGHVVVIPASLQVTGQLILSVDSAGGFATKLESSTQRFFKSDSACKAGALRAAVIESQSSICMCRDSGADHNSGHGWFCVQ